MSRENDRQHVFEQITRHANLQEHIRNTREFEIGLWKVVELTCMATSSGMQLATYSTTSRSPENARPHCPRTENNSTAIAMPSTTPTAIATATAPFAACHHTSILAFDTYKV